MIEEIETITEIIEDQIVMMIVIEIEVDRMTEEIGVMIGDRITEGDM